MATATAAPAAAPAAPTLAPAVAGGFEVAGHAPTLNPTLSSATVSASASAFASASASPSSSFSSQSAVAFHTPSLSATSSANSPSSPYDAHRLSHNSSKLPAFRFADLHKQYQSTRLVLPSLLQHIPPSPVSPKSTPTSNEIHSAPTTGTDAFIDAVTAIGIGITTETDTASPTTLPTTSDLQLHQQPHQQPQQHSADPENNIPPQNTHSTSLRLHDRRPSHRQLSQLSPRISSPIHELPESPPKLNPRSRASTYQVATQSTPATSATSTRRPASYPDRPVIVQSISSHGNVADPKTLAPLSRLQTRRAAAYRSRESNATDIESTPVETDRLKTSDTPDDVPQPPGDKTTKDWAQGQRELILPKTLQNSSPTDEKRKSIASRPPVSFKATTASTSTASVRVAPIRSFRSSGSRRSLGLDSSTSTMRSFDFGDDYADSNQRDRTLRALEGRRDDDYSQMTPPLSADADDTTGDVFMKIARQEPSRRGSGDIAPAEQPSAISFAMDDRELTDDEQQARVARSSHRRPLSAAVPLSYHHPVSPPQISRRLSDQQETSKKRIRQSSEDDSAADPMARALAYRSPLTRDRPSSAHPGEDLGRAKTFHQSSSRSTVNTPRSFTFQDPMGENSPYARRRPSLTDSNTGYSARSSAYRQSNLSYGQTRTYNSSPLVPKSIEAPRTEAHQDAATGVEGTESTATASTNAPSTVWDELDDLKSRIHRLELTGKLPATSGAAMSRASDERPPTATNTTMSTSPKRASDSQHHQTDAVSTTSSQREVQQPILLSAVSKSKPFLSEEVAKALEVAATDALALANMMGTAGQPGPISSGASTIGVGTNLTDRQLRRKADSICRSLTELVLALSEEAAGNKTVQVSVPITKDTTTPVTPTINKTFIGGSGQRRPSITSEQQTLPKPNANTVTSPRALSKYEERRSTMLNPASLPSPRFALPPGTIPSTPGDGSKTANRKSSLFIGRSRRAVTEEPEDGRRSSMLLRTRRAGTEEAEDSREAGRENGRQTSLLRSRRGTVGGEDEDESRFRAPSRAATELTTPARAVSHTYHSNTNPNELSSPASSALPRRRFGASSLTSRLVAPSTPSLATRRYLERTPEREQPSSTEKVTEERPQQVVAQPRHFSLSHTSLLNRASSISRRPNRDSTITNSSTAAQSGSYR
ncbi:hypothetical protein CORC01_12707 [Colletotrichum orchidophilum]|uniref:LPXTG-motif cell wall anchor domain-containing protein n=1 Tax=Colletotrichum orchidophilum TaxID=1209926 RepID=A0A1G4ASC5_9PEZI|nr:uncharacterized protein CORC01_12707 [Colletotrichum orchidophilum]OHE92016.1 hypothetical protein CORC01_12707 [Colletotrichum orchidophilum]